MMRRIPLFGSIAAALFLTGCASTSARRPAAELDDMLGTRTGARVSAVEKDEPIERAAAELLAQPLTPDSAVQLALLKNPGFRGKLAELGIAQAELAQATLIENPRFHISQRFARAHGERLTSREMGVSLNFLDMLTLPLRRRLASGQLEQAKYRLGHETLEMATAVKAAFFGFQAARQRLDFLRTATDALRAGAALAERQREAGNVNQLQLDTQQAAAREAALALARAEAEFVATRERLSALLGIQGREWSIAPSLPELPATEPVLEKLEPLALAQRWDLAAAKREPSVLKQVLRVNRVSMFAPFEIGIDSEREFDGVTGFGPEVEIGVPLFDRGQASSARIKAQLRQSQATIAGLEAQIRLDLRVAHAELKRAREAVETYRKELLPLKRRIVSETLKHYNFMLEGVFTLLQAKREELAAQSEYIESIKEYWVQWAELERAAGGRLPPEVLEAVQGSAPEKPEEKEQPAKPQEHQHH